MSLKMQYECQSCGAISPKWVGQCAECKTWNSFIEVEKTKKRQKKKVSLSKEAKKITSISSQSYKKMKTGIEEFDRVVGEGLTEGSLTLIGGEPGVGKSTLILEVIGNLSKREKTKVLYVSGEESESQIYNRAKRLNVLNDEIYLLHETSLEKIIEQLKKTKPNFFVLDSIQTTITEGANSGPGTISQIREVTYEVMNYCKSKNITAFIIGHVTKEGSFSGPKLLEHMVDTVLYFEGDSHNYHRILRTVKNRFGNTFEVGIFEMTEQGLSSLKNPTHSFIEENSVSSYGRCTTCILEGSRAIFVEVQALVNENKFGNARRTTQGIDSNRLAMLIAVIEKYFELPMTFHDIYLNVVGGLNVKSRDIDLAIIACILSSYHKKVIEQDKVFLGEVGLTGEVRKVPMLESRLQESVLHQYKKVVLSSKIKGELETKFDLSVEKIKQVTELFDFV